MQPWVHYVPVKNDYSDLVDSVVFFRGLGLGAEEGGGGEEELAKSIAKEGRDWSLKYWRKEDIVAYMFRLFLEYARIMSVEREDMGFVYVGEPDGSEDD